MEWIPAVPRWTHSRHRRVARGRPERPARRARKTFQEDVRDDAGVLPGVFAARDRKQFAFASSSTLRRRISAARKYGRVTDDSSSAADRDTVGCIPDERDSTDVDVHSKKKQLALALLNRPGVVAVLDAKRRASVWVLLRRRQGGASQQRGRHLRKDFFSVQFQQTRLKRLRFASN
jgi:hypothetical protein